MVNKRCITNYHFQFVWLETTYHHQILFNDRSGFQEPFTPTDVGLLNQETWTDIYLVLPTADFPQFIQGCKNLIFKSLRFLPICLQIAWILKELQVFLDTALTTLLASLFIQQNKTLFKLFSCFYWYLESLYTERMVLNLNLPSLFIFNSRV